MPALSIFSVRCSKIKKGVGCFTGVRPSINSHEAGPGH